MGHSEVATGRIGRRASGAAVSENLRPLAAVWGTDGRKWKPGDQEGVTKYSRDVLVARIELVVPAKGVRSGRRAGPTGFADGLGVEHERLEIGLTWGTDQAEHPGRTR